MIYILYGITLLTYILTKLYPQRTKLLSTILTVIFFIIIGSRWNTGGDWDGYMAHFNMAKTSTDHWSFMYQPVYLFLLKISPNITILNLIFSALSFSSLYLICRIMGLKNIAFLFLTSFIHIPILLYCGFTRQGVTATLISLAIVLLIYRKKIVVPILLTVFALGIHNPMRHFILETSTIYTTAEAVNEAKIISEPSQPSPPQKTEPTAEPNTAKNTESSLRAYLPVSSGTKYRIAFLAAVLLVISSSILLIRKLFNPLELTFLFTMLTVSGCALVLLLQRTEVSPGIDRIFYYFYPIGFVFAGKTVENLKKYPLYEIGILLLSMLFTFGWIFLSPNSKFYV